MRGKDGGEGEGEGEARRGESPRVDAQWGWCGVLVLGGAGQVGTVKAALAKPPGTRRLPEAL